MYRHAVSIIALALIFTLGAGPLVATAQADIPVSQTEILEAPAPVVEASSTEPIISEATEETVTTAEVPTEVVPVETIDPATYVAGEVIVKYKESRIDLSDSTDQRAADALVEDLNLATSETIDAQNIAVVDTEGVAVEQAIELLEANPNVEYAEPNYLRTISASVNDTYFNKQWALENLGQLVINHASSTVDADVDAPEAWNVATGTDIIVAVLDTGIDYNHPDLTSNMWDGESCVIDPLLPQDTCTHGYDFYEGDGDPLQGAVSESHGTHVAGIIAAEANNGLGIVGVAPGVKIMALRLGSESFTVSEVVSAIVFAQTNGARIINASFTGPASDSEKEAISDFQAVGGIFVTSASNNSDDIDVAGNETYPASYDLPNIITVAATDQYDALDASYSNYGAISVDLGAPGSNIYSTIPSNGYGYKSGTSMSAPMVAGAVALAKSYRPDLSASAIKAAILDSGDSLASLATTTVSGRRLNVNNMLLSLAPVTPTPDTTAPTITLIGANPLTLTVGDTFTDPGAEVTDDTDATTTITGTGSVDTSTAATYTLTYSATDTAGNVATSTTRAVVVSAPIVSSGGGGGGGGGSSRSRGGGGGGSTTTVTKPKIIEPSVPRFLTAVAPAPQVLGASTFVFSRDLSTGASGLEVTELQSILAKLGFYSGPISGFFGPLTQSALVAFQQSKGLEPAGRVGPQTRAVLNGSMSSTPTTSNTAAIISALQAQLQILLAQLALLQAKGA